MVFISYSFILFTLFIAVAYYLLPTKLQNSLLLLASLYFYWYAMPRFLPLLFTTGTMCYFAARLLENKDLRHRKPLFIFFILAFLAPLFIYKYLGFFSEIASAVFGLNSAVISLALPLGISFYTFQSLGYLIDCYNGTIKAERNYINCMLFISFFPQLLSGPIGRAKSLLPQYAAPRRFQIDNLRCAGVRFLCGLFKKAVIADNLGRFVDLYYQSPGTYPILPVTLLTVFLYALQIYFDFAGYSDMAIAAGQVFGIVLPENFAAPYLASSYREFWSRWHVSLTGWLRDYIYIPLGGNRKGVVRKRVNVLIVFLISGLWHGAAITFIIWGTIQGIFRVIDDVVLPKERLQPKSTISHFARSFIVVMCWSLSLIFFRADSLGTAFEVLRYSTRLTPLTAMIEQSIIFITTALGGTGSYAKLTMLLLVLSILLAVFLDIRMFTAKGTVAERAVPVSALPECARVAIYCFMFFSVAAIGQFGTSNFIYFKF